VAERSRWASVGPRTVCGAAWTAWDGTQEGAPRWSSYGGRRRTLGGRNGCAREGGPAALNKRRPACFATKGPTESDRGTEAPR
jgi:hypothetical protein